jgi:hypothetical protein
MLDLKEPSELSFPLSKGKFWTGEREFVGPHDAGCKCKKEKEKGKTQVWKAAHSEALF